jgi:MFS family permease
MSPLYYIKNILPKEYFNFGKALYFLLFIEILFNASWSLIGPFFAVFITTQIKGGDVILIATASFLFWISKSLSAPLIGFLSDRLKGIKDELFFMKVGIILNTLTILGYYFSYLPIHIIFFEIIHGIGSSLYYPPRISLLVQLLKEERTSSYFGLNDSFVGILIAFSILFGGILINFLGFKNIFLLSAFICFLPFLIIKKKLNISDKDLKL